MGHRRRFGNPFRSTNHGSSPVTNEAATENATTLLTNRLTSINVELSL